MPDNAAGLVYGTILVATLLSAESALRETYVKTVIGVLVVSMPRFELLGLQAGGRRLVGDVVVRPAPHERQLSGCQFDRGPRIVEPEPRASLDDSVQRELNGPRQPQSPRRRGHRPGKDAA